MKKFFLLIWCGLFYLYPLLAGEEIKEEVLSGDKYTADLGAYSITVNRFGEMAGLTAGNIRFICESFFTVDIVCAGERVNLMSRTESPARLAENPLRIAKNNNEYIFRKRTVFCETNDNVLVYNEEIRASTEGKITVKLEMEFLADLIVRSNIPRILMKVDLTALKGKGYMLDDDISNLGVVQETFAKEGQFRLNSKKIKFVTTAGILDITAGAETTLSGYDLRKESKSQEQLRIDAVIKYLWVKTNEYPMKKGKKKVIEFSIILPKNVNK